MKGPLSSIRNAVPPIPMPPAVVNVCHGIVASVCDKLQLLTSQ